MGTKLKQQKATINISANGLYYFVLDINIRFTTVVGLKRAFVNAIDKHKNTIRMYVGHGTQVNAKVYVEDVKVPAINYFFDV